MFKRFWRAVVRWFNRTEKRQRVETTVMDTAWKWNATKSVYTKGNHSIVNPGAYEPLAKDFKPSIRSDV